MNKKYKRLFGDMGIFALGALGSKLVLFLLLPIYTHVLTDSEYGIADLVFTAGDLLLPLISLSIFNGLLRFGLIEGKRQNSFLNASIVFLVGSFAAVVFTPFLGIYAPIKIWKWYTCAYVLAHFARSNTLIFLKVKNKNKTYSIASIVQALLLVGFNILFLVVLRIGIRGYLLSTILSNILLSIFAFVIGDMQTDIREASFDKQLFKEMVLYSAPYIFNDVSWWIIHSFDKIMIESMIGDSALGIYTAASKIPSLINALTSIFSQAWGLASIKEYDSTNEVDFYSTVFKYFSVFTFGVSMLIIAVTKPFMSFYVGKAFEESWHFVPLLLASASFSAISTFASGLFGALKQSKSVMTTTIAASITNIVVNFISIKALGIYGAVLGTVFAYAVVALSRMLILKNKVDVDFHIRKLCFISTLIVIQATLVGIDYHIVLTSLISVFLFIIFTKDELISIFSHLVKNRYFRS